MTKKTQKKEGRVTRNKKRLLERGREKKGGDVPEDKKENPNKEKN